MDDYAKGGGRDQDLERSDYHAVFTLILCGPKISCLVRYEVNPRRAAADALCKSLD